MILSLNEIKSLNYEVQLNASTVDLGAFVVSASKWEQKKDEVPNKITSIKAKEVAYLNAQTTADLLGNSNQVFIQKSQLGGGSPMIRGFSANSVLIVVDGVRMNNAIFRSGNLQNIISIDGNILDEAEIVFGPGSIIYGSDALGGVMDFHTRKIKYAESEEPLIHGQGLLRYSSANNENTGHAEFSYSKKNWGMFTSFSYSKFGDLRMGSTGHDEYKRNFYVDISGGADKVLSNQEPNIQRFTAYNQYNITQKFAVRLSDKIDLDYGFHLANTSDIPRYDRLIQYDEGLLKYAEWYYGPQYWMMHVLGMNLSGKKMYDNARLTFAYQDVEESRHDRKFESDKLRSRTDYVDVFSLNFDADKKLSDKSSLFYGLEGIYNYVNSEGSFVNLTTNETGPQATRYPDGGSDYLTSAAYINFKSNLNEKLTLQTGLRYSYVSAESRFSDTTFNNFPYDEITLNTGALNASLGMVYRLSEGSRINMNLASGFRAPNVDDMAKVFDSEPGSVIVPNDNLSPEYVYNTDLGLVRSFNRSIKIELTGFYTYITSLMIRKDFTFNGQDSIMYDGEMSKVQAIQNTGSGWIAGISFDFSADLTERLGFNTGFTFMNGEDNEGDAIRHVSPLFGSAGLSYKARKIKIKAYAEYNGQIAYENLALSEKSKPHLYACDGEGNPYSPSWLTINIKGFYQLNNFLQVNAGIENLFDVRYRPYSSGIVAPGRNFIIALRANF